MRPDSRRGHGDAGYWPDAKERVAVQVMLNAERDPAKRKLLTRTLGK